jgi:hypothetical protein
MREASKIRRKMKNDSAADNKSVDIAAAIWYNIEVILRIWKKSAHP